MSSPGKMEQLVTLDSFLEEQSREYGSGLAAEPEDMINEVHADGKMTDLGEKLNDGEVKGGKTDAASNAPVDWRDGKQ